MIDKISQEFDDMDDFEDDFDDKKNNVKNQEMSNRNLNKEFDEVEQDSFMKESLEQEKSQQDSFEENFEEEDIEEYKSEKKQSQKKEIEDYQDDSFEQNELLVKQKNKKNEQNSKKFSKFHENKENLILQNEKRIKNGKSNQKVFFDINQLMLVQQGEPRTLNELSNENQKLFTELKKVNEKLTEMIDRKGYENLLLQIQQKKKTDFKNRPIDIKIKTYDKEIQNNEKLIKNLEKDYFNYKNYQQKLDSTVLLNQIKSKIQSTDTKIKILRADIHNQKIFNKKQANKLVRKAEQVKRKNDFKKIMIEVDNYMQKITIMDNEMIKLNNLKTDLNKENEKLLKVQKQLYQETEQMGIIQVNEELLKKFEKLKKIKFKWKNFMNVSEHNVEQKVNFLKRDIYALEKKIENMYQKSEGYNQILENQHEMFQDFAGQTVLNKKLISLNDFGLKKKQKKKKVFSVKQKKKPPISSQKKFGRLEISRNKSKANKSKQRRKPSNNKNRIKKGKSKKVLPKRPQSKKKQENYQKTPMKQQKYQEQKQVQKNSINHNKNNQEQEQYKEQKKQIQNEKSEFEDSMDSLFDKKPQQQNLNKNPIQKVHLNKDDFQNNLSVKKEEEKDDLSMLLDKSKKKDDEEDNNSDFDFLDQLNLFNNLIINGRQKRKRKKIIRITLQNQKFILQTYSSKN